MKCMNPILPAIGLAAILTAVPLVRPAAAQDWGSSAEPSRAKASGYDYTGIYVQFGVSVGEIDPDEVGPPPFEADDVDTGGGFTMTGGYRVFPWLAAEANLSYLGGGDTDGPVFDDAAFFSVTIGPKFFPLGLLDEDDQPLPESFQPYALVGIGGGEYEFEVNGSSRLQSEDSTFIARFIFGFDFWATDHIGAFMEGGYHVASEDDINGTGLFTVGAQYRF